jgi:hypothetical protein
MITKRRMTTLLFLALFTLAGCNKQYVLTEPPANTGTVFQNPPQEVQAAARNALTKLNFAITQESGEYIEAVNLKPGETVQDNKGEMVHIWIKPRESSVLVLTRTQLRASGIAKQKEWDQLLIAKMMEELR